MLDMFATFREMPYPAFLDSSLDIPRLGRYSYLTADPFLILRSKGRHVQIERMGNISHLESNPFIVLQELLKRYRLVQVRGLPPFHGGAIGYFSYELAHHMETLPSRAVDDLCLPEMNVAFYDWTISMDRITGATWAVATGLPEGTQDKARQRLGWIKDRLRQVRAHSHYSGPSLKTESVISSYSRDDYLEAVKSVKDYIVQGDVYQVNISQRFEAPVPCRPWDLYLRLRTVNPAPFSAYLHYPEVTVLSASPEVFLHLENGSVSTRPMKGTRPRGASRREDQEMAEELRSSEKDRAENLMTVDLMRSDLGKVCSPGSIQVPELFTIEKYPTVFQMVSTIRGQLRPDVSAVELLQACFPGGSVTGAPKIRAMQIIDELEPTQRSVYCGAVGYIGFDGSMLMSIPIRILLVKGHKVYFQVGGGIVADSDPQAEYEETLHKARGSFRALGVQERTLQPG
jgi:para-aminobenzoate synthetase component 1